MKRKTKIKKQNRAKIRFERKPLPIYTTEHVFHIDDDSVTDEKALWRRSLCGRMVQMHRQSSRWPWCKICEKSIDDEIAKDRALARTTGKVKPNALHGKQRNRITRIDVQRFEAPAHILERLARGQEKGTATKRKAKTNNAIQEFQGG